MENKYTNRLIGETSPYLLQHAHNPVDWFPWGKEAFVEARTKDKPILLSIGYSACHWCHVMAHESFENEQIAALMNDLFINIKVDREERPDLDEIYMSAVQMLTGRGGWPMTVFLTPEGKPFYGGTYFPPQDRAGMPGFSRILRAVHQAYRERPADIDRSVTQIVTALEGLATSEASTREFSENFVGDGAKKIAASYDADNGGLGQAPKFPNAGVYELFLRHFYASKNNRYLEMVTHTLTKMAQGGIYDHLGGGFHRYSVDAKWLVPHFEKMLYDNAQLVRIFAHAYSITHLPLLQNVVAETCGYLLREMLHREGGFFSTQEADSDGEEGKFFVWTQEEINRLVGAEAGEIFGRMYDVSEPGNFEGKNILHPILTVAQASKYFSREPSEIEKIVATVKEQLFRNREKRGKPFRDEKIITAWNGLMLSGLAAAATILPRPEYFAAMDRTVEFFFSKMFRGGFLLHSCKDGQAKQLGYLDDYAFLGTGLLDAYQVLFDRTLLERAIELSEIMLREFWDERDGAFFYTGRSHEALISRSKPIFDASIPSGNSIAALLLLRLHHLTGRELYRRRAETVLRCYYDMMERQPFGVAHLICALDFYMAKPKQVVVVGDWGSSATRALLADIHSLYLPNLTLQLATPDERLEAISPLLAGKTQRDGKPTAYVCQNYTCSAPVTSWQELKVLLES